MQKKKILFVDDNADVLSSLRRMLRTMRKDWEMEFVGGGREALEKLELWQADVIVSDIRMPEMDGVELLTEVKARYPRIVRIALSGYTDREVVLKSVGPTHQFLAKPCDGDSLKLVITRSCMLQDLLTDPELLDLVTKIESLPSLPALYLEVVEELKSPKSSMAKIGEIISKDISMTAKIMQLVNSAFFGMPQHISNPSQAATLLGVDIIKALVLSVKIFSGFSNQMTDDLDLQRLWNHSNRTSIIAKKIASAEKIDKILIDDVFMAGVLHDVGILVLAANMSDQYRRVLRLVATGKVTLAKAEQIIFGKTHAQVGGYLMGLWGLPDPIVEAIYFHHNPSECPSQSIEPVTFIHIANALESHKFSPDEKPIESFLDMDYIEKLNLTDRIPVWCEIYRDSEASEENEKHE